MACLINNLYTLTAFNECRYNISGITKIYVAPFSKDVYSKLTIFNNQITTIDASIKFVELDNNKFNSKYTWVYNYDAKKYEHTLQVEILRMDWNKRAAIDSLIKSNLMFIVKDANGQYFYLGEKGGFSSNSATATTEIYTQNKNSYLFNFTGKSDTLPFGFDETLIPQITNPDCSDLYGAQPTWSPLYWLQYADCIVGSFPGFVNP